MVVEEDDAGDSGAAAEPVSLEGCEVGVDKLPSEQPARNRPVRRMVARGCFSTVTHYRNRT